MIEQNNGLPSNDFFLICVVVVVVVVVIIVIFILLKMPNDRLMAEKFVGL